MPSHPDFSALRTPCVILDEAKMQRNIDRLAQRAEGLGVVLRPHLKTAKSVDVAKRVLTGGNGPATVSTLAEAEIFAAAGVKDIVYAVGIAPDKLDRVLAIRSQGCDLKVILDSQEQAVAVADAARRVGVAIPALIEIDCDGHRGGVGASDDMLVKIAGILDEQGCMQGVITHAGESYGVAGYKAHAEFAEIERVAVVTAAAKLRAAGIACPIVSVGSTPTAHAVRDLSGVTELRAGVYMFFDLVMAGIEVCTPDDVAVSVLTTVIGHQKARNWILIDAGWMAMSRDRGTSAQAIDQGYGMLCDEEGNIIEDLIVSAANQEHGVISLRPGATGGLPEIPVGTRLRILPNHACATTAQHEAYHVIPAGGGAMLTWPRFRGW